MVALSRPPSSSIEILLPDIEPEYNMALGCCKSCHDAPDLVVQTSLQDFLYRAL